jgi:hypothetical protein
MSPVYLDSQIASLLRNQTGQVELRDPEGNLLGYFLPPAGKPNGQNDVEIPFTKEELDRAAKQTTGRPLEDILRDLRACE